MIPQTLGELDKLAVGRSMIRDFQRLVAAYHALVVSSFERSADPAGAASADAPTSRGAASQARKLTYKGQHLEGARYGAMMKVRSWLRPHLGRVAITKKGGVSAMRISWQTENQRLVSRWSEEGERLKYNPRWMQDASREVPSETPSPSVPAFTRVSPFGGGGWYAFDRP